MENSNKQLYNNNKYKNNKKGNKQVLLDKPKACNNSKFLTFLDAQNIIINPEVNW